MALESTFQSNLIKELRDLFEGCIILKVNANQLQGYPDLLILWNDKWASLEVKKSEHERFHKLRPNQEYYVSLADEMSFGAFIFPENKEAVLDELQRSFGTRRKTRRPQR